MAADRSRDATLELLGRWRLTVDGRALPVPGRDQRLITAVALLPPRPRRHLAELLWRDGQSRAVLDALALVDKSTPVSTVLNGVEASLLSRYYGHYYYAYGSKGSAYSRSGRAKTE